jgi:hypothetical protein
VRGGTPSLLATPQRRSTGLHLVHVEAPKEGKDPPPPNNQEAQPFVNHQNTVFTVLLCLSQCLSGLAESVTGALDYFKRLVSVKRLP